MKILHIIASLQEKYGGPSVLLPQLSFKQKGKNNDVEILTTYLFNEKDEKKYFFLNKGIKLRRFRVYTNYRFSFRLLIWLICNLKNYDCVHIHSIYRFPNDIAILISLFQKFPLVFSPHGSLDPYLLNRSQYKLFGIICKKLINFLLNIPLSNATFHFTAKEERKICILKNIVSKSFIIPPLVIEKKDTVNLKKNFLKDYLHINFDSFLIGYIGRLHEKKNIDSLIKGFNFIKNPKLKLVIIGPGSKEYKRYLKKIIKQTKNQNIFLLDFIPHDQIDKYMYSFDLYALPSHSENFGITILEALSLEIPVLISNKVNIYQNIENYKCGKIIYDNSDKSISRAIEQIVENKEEFKKMKENSTRLIKSEYSWDNLIQKYMIMYKETKRD